MLQQLLFLSKYSLLASSCSLTVAIRTRGEALLGLMALILAIYTDTVFKQYYDIHNHGCNRLASVTYINIKVTIGG